MLNQDYFYFLMDESSAVYFSFEVQLNRDRKQIDFWEIRRILHDAYSNTVSLELYV